MTNFFLTQIKIEKMKAIFNILSLTMEGSWEYPSSPNKPQDAQSSGRDEKYVAGVDLLKCMMRAHNMFFTTVL